MKIITALLIANLVATLSLGLMEVKAHKLEQAALALLLVGEMSKLGDLGVGK